MSDDMYGSEILRVLLVRKDVKQTLGTAMTNKGYNVHWKEDFTCVIKKGIGRTVVEIEDVRDSKGQSMIFLEFELSTGSRVLWKCIIGGLLGGWVQNKIVASGRQLTEDVVAAFEEGGHVLQHQTA